MLFGIEATEADAETAIALYWREFGGDAETRPYADESVRGVVTERDALDETIRVASEHWRIERMTRVDRNVLRLGTWELGHRRDVPTEVILDEAVELAKPLRQRRVRRVRQRGAQPNRRDTASPAGEGA